MTVKMGKITHEINTEIDESRATFIRTYERFWGVWKFAIGVFGLKTTAQ